MGKSFPHLMDIVHEIPTLDESAKVQLLIGRDAPELLKVREFRNGPKGAPWAQQLALGWTISGQMCLDFPSGPAHVLTRLTSLSTATERNQETGDKSYELVPCPNQFKVEDPFWNLLLTASLRLRRATTNLVSLAMTVCFWRL